MAPSPAPLLLALALLACTVHLTAAHGYLAVPISRNLLHNTDYCPHCLNAGGGFEPGSTSGGWPEHRAMRFRRTRIPAL